MERHRQGLLGRLHRQQHHRRPARAGRHRPDAAQPERLQRRRRRARSSRIVCGGSVRSATTRTVEATPGYTVVNSDGSLTNPFNSNLRNYTASGKYQINKNNTLVGVLDLQQEVPAEPRRRRHAAAVRSARSTSSRRRTCSTATGRRCWARTRSSKSRPPTSTCTGRARSRTSSTLCRPTSSVPSTFNITTGIYIDGPEPTGQRLRDAYRHQTNIGVTRYIDGFLGASHQLKTGFENWWTPTGTDGFDDLRRLAPALHRRGRRCNPTVRTRLRADRKCSSTTRRSTQKTQMRNFAGVRPGPRQLSAASR